MLFGPLNRLLKQREELTAGTRNAAEKSLKDAERKVQEYEAKMREAELRRANFKAANMDAISLGPMTLLPRNEDDFFGRVRGGERHAGQWRWVYW